MVCAYDPVGYGIPYNHLLVADYREQLVEHAVQILIVTLEHEAAATLPDAEPSDSASTVEEQEVRLTRPQAFSPGEDRKSTRLNSSH